MQNPTTNPTSAESNVVEAPAASVPTATNAASNDSGQFVTLTSLLIVVVIAMALTLAAVYAGASKGLFQIGGSAAKVVTLDVDRLIEAGLKANERKGASADPKASADAFQAGLKREVDRLGSEGFLIVNFRAVIAGSKQTDVTDELISRLGLNESQPK
jgi:hypothetical protein